MTVEMILTINIIAWLIQMFVLIKLYVKYGYYHHINVILIVITSLLLALIV